jgi:DNA repair protein RecO (recombination protein O)
MAIVKTLGVVLRRKDLGEADRIVTFLTSHHGKVKAVAKGCRRTKSRLGGKLDPLAVSELVLWRREGRDLAIVSGAELIEHFPLLSADLQAFAVAQCAAEMLDRSLAEGESYPRLFNLLVSFLRSLEAGSTSGKLLQFSLKAGEQLGYNCRVDRCASCASALPANPGALWLEYGRGGVVCMKCMKRASGAGERLSPAVAAALRAAADGTNGSEGPATEAVRALDRMLGYHQERKTLVSQRLLTALAVSA